MPKLLEYKCPGCASPLRFDADTRKLVCSVCGTACSPEEYYEKTVDTEAFETLNADETKGMVSYICSSCGGEIICTEDTVTTSCPFCGNPVAIAGNVTGEYFPKLILPFRTTKEQAVSTLEKHIKHGLLMKRAFRRQVKINEIKGVYLPMWVFDSTLHSSTTYLDVTLDIALILCLGIPYLRPVIGHSYGSFPFKNVPVSASDMIPNELLYSISPIDFSLAVPFDASYLAGYHFHRYASDVDECKRIADNEMLKYAKKRFAPLRLGGFRIKGAKLDKTTENKSKYGLFPVWLINTTWKGKTYTFAMNGCNGEYVSQSPISIFKCILLFLLTAVGVAAAVFAVIVIMLLIMMHIDPELFGNPLNL